MKIVKAELLWSRQCPHQCNGCGMKKPLAYTDEKWAELDLGKWERGFAELRNLGCEFVAIYGAEPLERMAGLPNVVRCILAKGMQTSIITSVYSPEKVQVLVKAGLSSITTSYDGQGSHKSRKLKALNGLELLDGYSVRDKAAVITASRRNQEYLAQTVDEIIARGHWCHFDIMHPGQLFGKCLGTEPLPLRGYLHKMLDRLEYHAKAGGTVPLSSAWFEVLRNNYDPRDVRKTWHCSHEREVGWVTIDWDGTVYPCDDFQVPYPRKLWEGIDWDRFEAWRTEVIKTCPGCAWSTHFEAARIARDGDLGKYLHNMLED